MLLIEEDRSRLGQVSISVHTRCPLLQFPCASSLLIPHLLRTPLAGGRACQLRQHAVGKHICICCFALSVHALSAADPFLVVFMAHMCVPLA